MTTAVLGREINVSLPPLHKGRNGSGGQLEIAECDARFIVCICGRRWGKTTLGVWKCIKGAISEPNVVFWWVGPSYPSISASKAWPTLKLLCSQIPDTKIREDDKYVTLANGSEIWIKSADNPESLRGPKLRGIVLDECAQIKEYTWDEVLRPALTDLKGWALFIGTPKGRNWVYQKYIEAESRPQWARFLRYTIDNPFIDPDEIEDARQDLPESVFKQEYEADFGASQFLVWPTFSREIHKWKGEIPRFEKYIGGLDFGGDAVGNHLSTGAVAGLTKNDELVFMSEFAQSGPNIGERQLNWMAETQQIVDLICKREITKPKQIRWNADKTQMWGIQLVRRMGYVISQTKGGKDSVIQGVDLVARRLAVRADGRPRLYYLPHLHFIPEAFESYRNPEPRPQGFPQPTGPLKIDDDMPDAIRYTVEGVDRLPIGNPQELYKGQLAYIESSDYVPKRFKLKKAKNAS